jgi:hypothetical protein
MFRVDFVFLCALLADKHNKKICLNFDWQRKVCVNTKQVYLKLGNFSNTLELKLCAAREHNTMKNRTERNTAIIVTIFQ